MAEKVTLQSLIEIFCKENQLGKDLGESLVKTFFDVIVEGLQRDKIVKIKGLGTFKIIEIEPRESVNVNTGERFQIAGHNKVSFVPDGAIKDLINQPFASFETILLNDKVKFDDKQEDISDFNGVIETVSDTKDIESDDSIHPVSSIAELDLISNEQEKLNNMETDETKPNISNDDIIEQPKEDVLKETSVEDSKSEITDEPIASDDKSTNEPILEQEPSVEEPKELKSDVDKIIASELGNAPKPIVIDNLNDRPKRKKGKHRDEYFSPKVAMGILSTLIILAFCYVIYWFFAPETPVKPVVDSTSSFAKSPDSLLDHVPNQKNDTLTMADKALMLSQSSDLDAMDDSSKENLVKMVQADQKLSETQKASTKTVSAKPANHQSSDSKASSDKAVESKEKAKGSKIQITGLKTIHVMAKGENLYTIAKTYLGSKDKIKYLLQYNHFKNPNLVTIGTKIRIPILSEQ